MCIFTPFSYPLQLDHGTLSDLPYDIVECSLIEQFKDKLSNVNINSLYNLLIMYVYVPYTPNQEVRSAHYFMQ